MIPQYLKNSARWMIPRIRIVLSALILAAMISCASAPEHADVPLQLPDAFSRSGEGPIEPRWWKSLNDVRLNRLVERALDDNFDLKTAWDRLKQARATERIRGAGLYPQVDASGGAKRIDTETDRAGHTYAEEYSLGLTASYEVDVWGRVRSGRNAAEMRRRATRQDLRAAAISLSAQVAETWYSLVEQRAQGELLEEQIQINKQYLKLIELRFQKGEVPATDVLQQRKLLEATRTERSQVTARIKNRRYQLAVLLGQIPGKTELPEMSELPGVPEFPPTGVPAEWMMRRPDIRSAYLRVKANNSDVAAAIADRYPRFDLKASISSAATRPTRLFEEWISELASTVTVPLIDGDRLDATVDRSRAQASESLNNYAQTVLEGVREVENALSDETQQRETVRRLRRQLRLSEQTLQQLLREYRNGTQEFLRVLDELRSLQDLERRLIESRKNLVIDRIALYRALGTGFDLSEPDTPARAEKPDLESESKTQRSDTQ